MNRILRRTGEAVACLALGSAFTLGCVYAATPWNGVPNVESSESAYADDAPVGTTFRSLTPEEIDVLAESDEEPRRWELCEMNSDYAIYCTDDGSWHEYPAPATDDGSITDPGAYAAMIDLDLCADGADRPCRMDMVPTYAVGGDGTVHDDCTVVLLDAESSEMVCADDTVWAS